jgi:SAM-dependent methyltransferase
MQNSSDLPTMSDDFRDLFSERAADYARYRPSYPAELFSHLASLAPGHDCAWDCATGNGQAAVHLARHFDRVVATDASSKQIEHAMEAPNVQYRVARAEDSGLENHSVDLVNCAQAAHWFDLDGFYGEVRRVVKPGGVIALITYALPTIDERLDDFVHAYANHAVGPYWPPERTHIDARYATLPFPFDEVAVPSFDMTANWTAEEFLAFLGTWSATRAYMLLLGTDPRVLIADNLKRSWGAGRRAIRWPITVRAGYVG